MKKTKLIAFFLILSIIILLTACSSPENINNADNSIDTNKYRVMSAYWDIYETPQELLDISNLVFCGNVLDISFAVLDGTTGLNIIDEPYIEGHSYFLETIYKVEVITSYKGECASIINVRVGGGLINFKEDEQRILLQRYNLTNLIPIWDPYTEYKIDEPYLFVLYQFDIGDPTILNLDQSIYKLDNPEIGKKVGNVESYSNFPSVKEIVSEFGQDKWNEFNTELQKSDSIYKSERDK